MTTTSIAAVRAKLPKANVSTSLDWVLGGAVGVAFCALLVIGLGSLLGEAPAPADPPSALAARALAGSSEPTISVLLMRDPVRLELSAGRTGEVAVAAGRHRWRERGTIALEFAKTHVQLGARRLRGPLRLHGLTAARRPSALRIDERLYEGEIVIQPPTIEDRSWRIVNRLPLESYLCGVIGSEMPLSFPRAALRAQAVAARSYACYQIATRGVNAVYHLRGDSSSQVYGGRQRDPRALDAVRATRATVLGYRGELFESFFHSTCGGATAEGHSVFGAPAISPLSSVPCGRCQKAHHYRWKASLARGDVERILRPVVAEHRVRLGRIRALEPIDRQPGGHAAYIRVRHSRGSFEIDATRLRQILTAGGVKGLRSTAFDSHTSADGRRFRLVGRGWGHGVGLCQHGARGFAAEGASWQAIIAHYYPGSETRTLW